MATVAFDLETKLPATFTAPNLSEEEFLTICNEFPDARVEYDACEGTVILMPPTDFDTSEQNANIIGPLLEWRRAKGGKVGGPDGGFRPVREYRCGRRAVIRRSGRSG